MFRKYHYLNDSLNKSAKCSVGLINETPVVFHAMLHQPHAKVKNMKRGHRLVVLPDYQGLGIGNLFTCFIGDIWLKNGFRYVATASAPSLIHNRIKNKKWILTSQTRHTTHGGSSTGVSSSSKRFTCSFEYVGEK